MGWGKAGSWKASPVKDHLCGNVVLGRLLRCSSLERTEQGGGWGELPLWAAALSCRFTAGWLHLGSHKEPEQRGGPCGDPADGASRITESQNH